MNQLGPEMGNYLLAGTTPVDENKMALNPGAINGGFFEWKDEDELQEIEMNLISLYPER